MLTIQTSLHIAYVNIITLYLNVTYAYYLFKILD